MIYNFYIVDNSTVINNPQALSTGVRIHKLPSQFNFQFTKGNGPYSSLEELIKRSFLYSKIKLSNPSRAEKIRNPKNISTIKDMVITKEDLSVTKDFIALFEHCLQGKIVDGKITGIHYYDPSKVKIVDVIKQDNKTGVTEAEVEFFDIRYSKFYKKNKPTTLFPLDWNLTKLFHEILFAVNTMKRNPNANNIYYSKTESGIAVEIVRINNKLKSIYPLIDS